VKRFLTVATAAALAAQLAACGQSNHPLQQPSSQLLSSTAGTAPRGGFVDPARQKASPSLPTLESPIGGPARDAAVTERVKHAIDKVPDVNAAGIEVATTDGVVTLYGAVEVPNEREKVASVASGVDGVRSVVNNLIVIRGS
jgi:BON domain